MKEQMARVQRRFKRLLMRDAVKVRGKKRADPDRVKGALDFAITEAETSGNEVTISQDFARLLRSELDHLPNPRGAPKPSIDEMAMRRWARNRYEQLREQDVPSTEAYLLIKDELADVGRYMEVENVKQWIYYTDFI